MIRRREFLGSLGTLSLAGCGSRRRSWSGSLVGASHGLGHRLRDGSGFPEPSVQEDVDVAVIGSGIAGLVAAWRLRQAGRSVTIFELEPEAGGNSAGGRNEIAGYPWGAHYIPVPGDATTDTRELLEDLGALRGGRPDETFLCHDPVERLYFRGEWQEGLVPQVGLDAAERESIARFLALMNEWRGARGNDGRRAFAIPVDESSADPRWREIDRLSMAEWLDREHFRGGELRWYIDYCCRDDYGAGISAVSAWAGVHYFASRDSSSVLTWPEGNAWVVHRLCERLPGAIRGSQLVYRATAGGELLVFDSRTGRSRRVQARAIVCATPRFVAQRLVSDLTPAGGLEYSPWLVANLRLRRPISAWWDNVFRDSRSLGYVVATHQHLTHDGGPTVITYYRPLDDGPPAEARRLALGRRYDEWCEDIVSDLECAHPGIAGEIECLDARIWGHGMIRPVPGFIWGESRARMASRHGRIVFAHSDMSGISIFEEACARGAWAAREVEAQS